MNRASTYLEILQDWANLAHLDYENLVIEDQELFRSAFNRHARRIHNFTDWPETLRQDEWDAGEKTLEFGYLEYDQCADEVLTVWDKNPRENPDARMLKFRLGDQVLYLVDTEPIQKIWVKYSVHPPLVKFKETDVHFPRRYHSYILYAALADWYGADDMSNAERYRGMAEGALIDEAELISRRINPVTEQHQRTYSMGG